MNTTTNPGVTPADIEANIASEIYFTAAEGFAGSIGAKIHAGATVGMTAAEVTELLDGPISMLTLCILVLYNGHTVTGEAHCQDPAKFDPETGRQAARANAIDKLWPMVVFSARQRALDLAVQP